MPQKVITSTETPSRFILLGEDDADDQEMLKDVFTSIDTAFILFFVNNGGEIISALEKLKNDQLPCLIVLDYNMPGLNAADILRELSTNERYKNIPKVVWSTAGSEKFRKLCLELGALDYVMKPNNITDLERIARYMLSLCAV
ncbi:MAG TPA: response regulator [Chitinophagaceae bacterium]|nr:response regulator [Chitinophagaceae bacterium]